MMLILTGEKGCGKSMLLKDILTANPGGAQGFLSLKTLKNGIVSGISLLILPSLETLPMATTTPMATAYSTRRFYFYPGTFDKVNGHFCNITKNLPFVFDEFGILEMEKAGHYPIFKTLTDPPASSMLLVVRKNLLESFLSSHAGPLNGEILDMDCQGTQAIRDRIASFLSEHALLTGESRLRHPGPK
ncbi:MAG: hypothetical protein ABFD70_08435 [Syntrophaceae bacterium]